MKTIAIVGTMDTKGKEFAYLKEQVEAAGVAALVINAGIFECDTIKPDIPAEMVAHAAGATLEELRNLGNQGKCVATMTHGVAEIVTKLCDEGKIDGLIVMGGGQGTAISVEALNRLPIGFPKVLMSTIATICDPTLSKLNDTLITCSIVDVAGLNSVLKTMITNSAAAITGMAKAAKAVDEEQRFKIAMSMQGVTTPCVSKVRKALESEGFEPVTFAASGMGGRTMEQMIRAGYFQGVVDISITEVGQEYIGGAATAGPDRLEAAGALGIPQVVSLGGLDLINSFPLDRLPEKFKGRKFHMHNPTVPLMRTSAEENIEVGKIVARKLNAAKGETVLVIPAKGLSDHDKEGGAFYDPQIDAALFQTVKSNLKPEIQLVEIDKHINDPAFAEVVATVALDVMKRARTKHKNK